MIVLKAVVVRSGKGKAWVRLSEHQGGCGRCDEPGGCHALQFSDMFKGVEKLFAVDDPLGLKEDEGVLLKVEDDVPLRAALASYGLGTLLALAGAALGVWLAPRFSVLPDLGAGIGLAAGVVLMPLIVRQRAKRGGAKAWHLKVERAPADASCKSSCKRQGE